jgi:hypothetical protein
MKKKPTSNIFSKLSEAFKPFAGIKGNVIIERTEKDPRKEGFRPFVTFDREIMNDTNLSIDARFLMIYLLDKPDESWNINNYAIRNITGWSLKHISALFTELEKNGYGKRYQFSDPVTGYLSQNYFLISELKSLPEENTEGLELLPDNEPYRLPESRLPDSYQSDSRQSDSARHSKTHSLEKINYSKKKNINSEPEKETAMQKIKGGYEAVKKNVDAFFTKNLNKEQEEILGVMLSIPGMKPDIAESTVRNYDLEIIKAQIKFLPGRKIRETAGQTLISSIIGKDGKPWGPPGVTSPQITEKPKPVHDEDLQRFYKKFQETNEIAIGASYQTKQSNISEYLLQKYYDLERSNFAFHKEEDMQQLVTELGFTISSENLRKYLADYISGKLPGYIAKYANSENLDKFILYFEQYAISGQEIGFDELGVF